MNHEMMMRMLMGGAGKEKKVEEKWEEKRFKHKITSTVVNSAKTLGSYKILPYFYMGFVLSLGFFSHQPQMEGEQGPTISDRLLQLVFSFLPFFS